MDLSVRERIDCFKKIRDLPYTVSTNAQEVVFNCVTKSEQLAELLKLPYRYRLCTFSWQDLPLPTFLKHLAGAEDEYHQYLEVLVPETDEWVVVDPSWDSALQTLLPVSTWDGLTSTDLAVSPKNMFSPEESARLLNSFTKEDVEAYFAKNGMFLAALNKYLERFRGQYLEKRGSSRIFTPFSINLFGTRWMVTKPAIHDISGLSYRISNGGGQYLIEFSEKSIVLAKVTSEGSGSRSYSEHQEFFYE